MDSKSDHDLLIELNVKMDMILSTQIQHGTRILALEQWKWRWVGATAVGMFILTFLGNILSRMLVQ